MKRNNINKHEVICAFYDSTDETKTEHHDFMNILVKHRWRLRPLYFKNNYGHILIVFYKKRLKSIRKFVPEENIDFFDGMLNGEYRHCSRCGCGYLTYCKYIYRNNNGCVGRSYECEVCQDFSDKAVHKISEHAMMYGSKKTIMKLLKDKSFRRELNGPADDDDELPY